MLWGCFAASGPGELVGIYGIVKKEDYREIIEIMSGSLHLNFIYDGNRHSNSTMIVNIQL